MPTYNKESFRKRGIAQVGEIDAQIFLDAFYQAYANSLTFDGRARKAYFFDTATMVEQGGQATKNVLIGSYELNQEFHALQTYTPPPNGTLKIFTKGNRNIQAILFPTPIQNNTYLMGYGGQATATQLESLLGLQSGDIQNFMDNGTDISFYISVNYEIPAGAFANNSTIIQYLDNDGKVTKVNSNAFLSCLNLTTSLFNAATDIGTSAFDSCMNGTSHSFDSVITLNSTALYDNELMTALSLPSCTKMGIRCLSTCVALSSLNTPIVDTVKDNVFEGCSQLMSIELPMVTALDQWAFANWGGPGYTLTVPTAMGSDPAVLSTQANGTTIILI